MREPDQSKAPAKRYPPLEAIFQMLRSGCCSGVYCRCKHRSAVRTDMTECPFCREAKLEPFCASGREPGLKSFSRSYKATMMPPSTARACETVEAYVRKICEGRRLFRLIEPTGRYKAKTVGMIIGSNAEGTRLLLAIPGKWRYIRDTEFELHANLEDLVEVNFLGIELRNFRKGDSVFDSSSTPSRRGHWTIHDTTSGRQQLPETPAFTSPIKIESNISELFKKSCYEKYKQRKAFERRLAVRWEAAEDPADVAKPSAEYQLRARLAGLYANHEYEEALLASVGRVIDNESIYSRRKRLLD